MINGERIRQAREIKGITQAELADAVGLQQSHIALFEQNYREPNDHTLGAISIATGFPPAFFRKNSAPEFPLGSLLYRRRKSMSSRDRDKIRQVARLIFETIQAMSNRFKPLELRIPRLSGSPTEAARVVRSSLSLSPDTPVTNLVHRLERNGVVVVSVPYEIEEHDAFSVWADTEPRNPVIVMTAGKPGDRQQWTVAHELGHLVLHQAFNALLPQIEDEADEFASEFLMPEEIMRECLRCPITLTLLADLKARWRVSMQALVMRAYGLKIITDGQRRYIFRQMAAKGWLHFEPVPIPSEKPRLLKKLAESIFGPNFSTGQVADLTMAPPRLLGPIIANYASVQDMRGSAPARAKDEQRSNGKLLEFKAQRKRI